MGYQELYRPALEEVRERYELMKERVGAITEEETVAEPFGTFFRETAARLCELYRLEQRTENALAKMGNPCAAEAEMSSLWDMDLETLREENHGYYRELSGANYENSFANPAAAVGRLGGDFGKWFSLLYAKILELRQEAVRGGIYELTIYSELFVELYNAFEDPEGVEPKNVEEMFYWFFHDYQEVFMERILVGRLDTRDDYYVRIVEDRDLSDLRYLYHYGYYVGEYEEKMAAFLATLSQEEIQSMADTFTEGLRKGFLAGGKDISKKKRVEICYPMGFERMVKAAMANFRKMGLEPVIRRSARRTGVTFTPANEQYVFDHKADEAAFLDKAYVERKLECIRNVLEHYKEAALVHAGPTEIESFGGEPFLPVSKEENWQYSKKQQELNVYQANMQMQLLNQYMHHDEQSYTIIAYPTPAIGENFQEIFRETMAINNLNYETYQKIQQCIIDVLDQGEYVEIKGKGANETDLRVALYPLKDPARETIFENCVADVNIPVGEVFTSPKLSGTNGVLHVSQVFLGELKYVDLKLTFSDGKIVSYTCKNHDTEEENQEFIKENLLYHHDSLPMGEFAIGTNTTAYAVGKKYGIAHKLPILIAEKTGPHFAVGDTCYSFEEDVAVYNPDGKEIVARDNEITLLRKEDPAKAYFSCHTDITIPYEELDTITVHTRDGKEIPVIAGGFFVVPGTEELNEPLKDLMD